MKKVIILLMVSIMILGIGGCNNVSENDEKKNTTSTTVAKQNENDNEIDDTLIEEETNVELEDEETYTHTAIAGAVIVEQDGSKSFTYKGQCDECGKIDSVTKNYSSSAGTFKSGYLCSCGNQQEIEIESELE